MIPSRSAINRANAKHSTGPKSEAGKQKSSLNALRHGLTGQIVVMPNEDRQAYQSHLESFIDEYRPEGPTEAHLVQALADTSWRLNRVAALETNILTLLAAPEPDPIKGALAITATLESQSKALSNLSMHTQRLSRQFERTVNQLRDLQEIRKSEQKSPTICSISWKCTNPKEKPITPPKMASFFQTLKSPPPNKLEPAKT